MGHWDEFDGWVEDSPPTFSQASISGKHQLTHAEQQLGAQKGGIARRKKLSPERRREIAQKAAQARWGKC